MRVLFVGDTHGDTHWWLQRVESQIEMLGAKAVIQVGDFGWWPQSPFMDAVARSSVPVYFIDGNHEHHRNLAKIVARHQGPDGTEPVHLRGNLHFLPRGARMEIAGVRLAFLGGAHSIDRKLRKRNVDWFEEEAITVADLERLGAGGEADLLVTHDAPSGYPVPGAFPESQMGPAWLSELDACATHRGLISVAAALTLPKTLIHGHYHSRYSETFQLPHGWMQVHGLDQSGTVGNFLTLDFNAGQVEVVSSQSWSRGSGNEGSG